MAKAAESVFLAPTSGPPFRVTSMLTFISCHSNCVGISKSFGTREYLQHFVGHYVYWAHRHPGTTELTLVHVYHFQFDISARKYKLPYDMSNTQQAPRYISDEHWWPIIQSPLQITFHTIPSGYWCWRQIINCLLSTYTPLTQSPTNVLPWGSQSHIYYPLMVLITTQSLHQLAIIAHVQKVCTRPSLSIYVVWAWEWG